MSAPRRPLSWEGKQQLSALIALAAERADVDARIAKAVRKARSLPADVSWQDVGGALGMSKTAAQRKYADVAPKVRNRRKRSADG